MNPKPKYSAIKDRLQLVPESAEDLDLEQFPDFMIIGPQRGGTTWLHANLCEHPQIFMPPEKELYYFNTLSHPEIHPTELPSIRPDLAWYLKFFKPSKKDIATRDTACREQFGEPYEITMRGEGTASYAVQGLIDLRMIDDILLLNPQIKIMFMVRDPLERAWSHAKKDLVTRPGRDIDEVSLEEWDSFLRNSYQIHCGHFTEFYGAWESRLQPENIFVGRFIDIATDPKSLLLRAFDFLGVRSDSRYITEQAREKVNPSAASGIPDAVRPILEELFNDQLDELRSYDLI